MDKNSIVFVSIILRSRGISNVILTATEKNYRDRGLSAFGVHNCIKRAIELGDKVFDFNGANSPKRGDDKHSYGAVAKLYFEISYSA